EPASMRMLGGGELSYSADSGFNVSRSIAGTRQILNQRKAMIDVRDEMMSPASIRGRRLSAPVSAGGRKSGDFAKKSLRIERRFSDAKVKPFEQVEWERRTAEITD